MIKVKAGFVSIFFLAAGGCATVSNNVSLDKITPRQRVYIGKLNVNFNGDEKPRCEIYLNYDLAPSIKLAEDGVVFYKTDRDKLSFRSIACLHKASNYLSAWHHQEIPVTAISKTSDSLEIAYFGDIKINWKIDPETTIAAAQKDYESHSATKVGRVNESGELKTEINDNLSEMEKIFFLKNPDAQNKGYKIKSSLVAIKKD